MNLWEGVGRNLIAPQTDTSQRIFVSPPERFVAARASHFSCFAKKSNQKKATPIFALFLRCSQRARPAQIARRRANRAQWAHGAGLRPRVAPLLGVEYTGTPFERSIDRFAMGDYRERMREAELRLIGFT